MRFSAPISGHLTAVAGGCYTIAMQSENLFRKEYARLHPKQKEAVDHIYGPLMVLAGPGTGKTHVITMRIANILRKADTRPDQVLAITFTDAAAKEMRKRLSELIGSSASHVKITTFHSFCNEILETYPEYASLSMGSRPIEEVEQLQLMEDSIDSLPLKLLRTYGNPHYFITYIRRNIQKLKQEGITPEKFNSFISGELKKLSKKRRVHITGPHRGKERADVLEEEHMLKKNKELARVYASYEKLLREGRLYDFTDMILYAVSAIKKHRVLARILRERYEFILIDEHQDTNNSQQSLIELLLRGIPDPNVCVVGDEKQAIYRFQGGSMENFLYFKKIFPSAKAISLEKNFRSQQGILNTVHRLGTEISPRAPRLEGVSPVLSPVRIRSCATVESELDWVARDIRRIIHEGASPGDIAVLYRDNKDAENLHEALGHANVGHTFETEQDIFSSPYVRNAIAIVDAITHMGDERKIITALHADCFNIEPYELYRRIEELSGREKKSVFSENPDSIGKFESAVGLLRKLAIEDRNSNVVDSLESVLKKTGLMASILARDDFYRHMNGVRALFDIAKGIQSRKQDATLADFLEYIHRIREHGIRLKQKEDDLYPEGNVRCMTAHKAKGREFGHVYIVHAYDGHWGNRSVRDPLPFPEGLFSLLKNRRKADMNEDEMRLLYVACTRAKRSLCISYPRVVSSGREASPTRFLDLLDERYVSFSGEYPIARNASSAKKAIIPIESGGGDGKEKDFLLSLLKARGISVTAVNNFYDCAWKFIYVNLLRLPETKGKWEQFGTSVHGALYDFFSKYAREKASKKYLMDSFQNHLKQERLDKKTYSELLEKGIAALGSYYDSHPDGWHKKYLLEYDIRGVDAGFGVPLRGKLDKVELLDTTRVRVIDYKTGTPKSRNDIEGKTRNSNGGIKRQLVFYRMLLDNLAGKKYIMTEGVIEFIESDRSGKNRTEAFTVTEEEIKKLNEEIRNMISMFEKGTYESAGCGKKECEFCSLRNSVRVFSEMLYTGESKNIPKQ